MSAAPGPIATTPDDARARLHELSVLTGACVRGGNEATALSSGAATFDALLDAIHRAERFVALSAHVFWEEIARDVARALAARARAGLPCFVLLDGLQSVKTGRSVLRVMRRSGVRVVRARLPWRHPLRLNRRVHRNLVVIDGELALVGGVGIGDDWRPSHRRRAFRDRDLLIRGPVVEDVLGSFLEEWLEATGQLPPELAPRPAEPASPAAGDMPMLALRSRGGTGTSPLELALRTTIASARFGLDISTAYLVPPRAVRRELGAAARRGVRVRVLVAGEDSNRPSSRRAGQASYTPLLRAGVEIHEYRPAMLHAKAIVVDGSLWAVGSANLDNRALLLDDEIVVWGADASLARQLTEFFEDDLGESHQIRLERWRRRPWRRRPVERAAHLIRRDL